jgi:FAD/FMN-containing dehydrogenase
LTGFTCDNVVSYQVVLASGSIVTASASQNSGLFVALKGGSNNFGIVTQITYKTYKLSNIWAGSIIYDGSTAAQNIQAFSNFIGASNFDTKASLMQTFGFGQGQLIIVNQPIYAAGTVNPPALAHFSAIQPQYENTMAITTLPAYAVVQDSSSPSGL